MRHRLARSATAFLLALALAGGPAVARPKDRDGGDDHGRHGDRGGQSYDRHDRGGGYDDGHRSGAGTDYLQPEAFVERRPRLNAAQAAREAQMRYGGGRVLSVDPAGEGYRVKLVRDGDVRIVFIPAR